MLFSVEKKVYNLLSAKFSVIFDGWTGGNSHFVSVFAAYPCKTKTGYRKLLGISPMEKEDSLDATDHYEFIEYVLEVHVKLFENVVAIVGDKTSTNKAFARRVGSSFVGCHRHRYNIVMKDIISNQSDVIEGVQLLMKKLSYQITAEILRQITPLTAKQANETRWCSTFTMLKRYVRIKEYIPLIKHQEVGDLLLSSEDD